MITSEFNVKVVKIATVAPHPNADRLDIVNVTDGESVWSGCPCIVSKGSFKEGDYAVFVSVDSMVPLVGPCSEGWEFLRSKNGWKVREDGTVDVVGRERHRIKPERLRGIKSYGCVIPIPSDGSFYLGQDVASQMNIVKREDDVNVENPSDTRPTRKGWFSRFINRWFGGISLHHSAPEYSVHNLRYSNPFEDNTEPVSITEKIHGTNVRFGKVKGKLVVGSHRTWKTDTRSFLQKLFRTAGFSSSHYYKQDIWTSAVTANVNVDELPEGIIFYGEVYGKTPNNKDIQPGWNYGCSGLELRVFPSCYNLTTYKWEFSVLKIDSKLLVNPISVQNGVGNVEDIERTIPVSGNNPCVEGVVVHSLCRPGVAAKFVFSTFKEQK